jgi:mRNA interferase MazF
MHRGEVWWADLGLPRCSAPALRRPVLIVSADPYNRSDLRTVTVAVLTTNRHLAALPGNVTVAADLAGLASDSVVDVTQLATIDRAVLEDRVAALPDWLMAEVDAGLARARGEPPAGDCRFRRGAAVSHLRSRCSSGARVWPTSAETTGL